MVREAEQHAQEDKKKRELVEARNQADTLIYSTEKTIREMGDKLDQKTKSDIEAQITKLRATMEGDNKDAIQQDVDALMQLSHKVAEEAYKRAAGAQAQPGAGGESEPQKKPDEDVVDADFEEVKK